MRAAAAGGLGTLAGTLAGAIAAAPAELVAGLAAAVAVLLALVLLSDRTAERAALLIAAVRGRSAAPRLPRRTRATDRPTARSDPR